MNDLAHDKRQQHRTGTWISPLNVRWSDDYTTAVPYKQLTHVSIEHNCFVELYVKRVQRLYQLDIPIFNYHNWNGKNVNLPNVD